MPAPPPIDAAAIGTRIRAARHDKGMTQDGLAASVGVSRSAVAQWETGRAGQLNANLARVAEALGVPVNWLMYGDAPHAALNAATGDEIALLNLYRTLQPEDRQILLHTARRLARRPPG